MISRRFNARQAVFGWLCLLVVVLVYGWLAFVKLSPDAVYAGDIGVKYIQAEALVQHKFRALDIPYPGAAFDPDQKFFPVRPPFIMRVGGNIQAIFSPVSAVINGVFVAGSRYRGMILASFLSATAVVWAAWRLGQGAGSAVVPLIVGLATPLWFYGVVGWEHAPAVAFSTAAFLVASRATSWKQAAMAGLLLGAGATIRDEVLLIGPGLAFGLWRRLSWRAAGVAAAAVIVVLAAAGALEVFWFHRPLAAHLLHAVQLLRSVAQVASGPNPDVPALAPLTWQERYDAVVVYWLVGYGGPLLAIVPVALLLRWIGWRLPALLTVAILLWYAVANAWGLLTGPRWVAGLYRLSPFLIMMLLPSPASAKETGWLRLTAIVSLITYFLLALFGTDTIGGKSFGPRLLLPLVPILAVGAWQAINEYLRARSWIDRWTGRLGLALVGVALAIHLGAGMRAYAGRSADDGATVKFLRDSRAAIVVADDPATAQLLLPLYFQKVMFLVDSQPLADELAAALSRQQFIQFAVVSRRSPAARFDLPGFHKISSSDVGRMTVEEWHR